MLPVYPREVFRFFDHFFVVDAIGAKDSPWEWSTDYASGEDIIMDKSGRSMLVTKIWRKNPVTHKPRIFDMEGFRL